MITVIVVLVVIAVLLSALYFTLAVIAARRLVLPRDRPGIPVLAYDGETLTVPATPHTLHPGTFGIWTSSQREHAVIGAPLSTSAGAKNITRKVLIPPGRDLLPGERITWTSHVFPGPEALSPDSESIDLRVPDGIAPAWLIPAKSHSNRWAIHIHGIRTTRVTALRSVPAGLNAGMNSLVVSYRGDGEGPTETGTASMLGSTEWQDMDAAVDYITNRGGTQITFIAWSMGAQVALNYLAHGKQRERISSMVLIAPITDWNATLAHALRRSRLPLSLANAAAQILASHRLHRFAGTTAPVDLKQLDWTRERHVSIPTLVIHSTADSDAPIDSSRRFAQLNASTATLLEVSSADHALEYNTQPEWFTDTVTTWLNENGRRGLE